MQKRLALAFQDHDTIDDHSLYRRLSSAGVCDDDTHDIIKSFQEHDPWREAGANSRILAILRAFLHNSWFMIEAVPSVVSTS